LNRHHSRAATSQLPALLRGQSISLIGTWITRIATSWLVYRLTGSELLLGVVAFSSQIPLLVLAPIARTDI
jgi:hypothetical protein